MTAPEVTPEMVEAAAGHEFTGSTETDTYGVAVDRVECLCGEWAWDSNDEHCYDEWVKHLLTAALAAAPAIEINPDDWMISCDQCGRQVRAVEWFRGRGDRGAELVRAVLIASGWQCDDETGIDTCPVCLAAAPAP